MHDLGLIVYARGRTEEADSLFRAALALQSAGDALPGRLTAALIASLASIAMRRGRMQAADSLLREALRIQENTPSPDSMAIAGTLETLAYLHDDDPLNYEPLLRRAYEMERKVRGADHPRTLANGVDLALMLAGMGRFDEAVTLIDQVQAGRERVLGPNHPQTGHSLVTAGFVRLERGDAAAAVPLLRRAAEILWPQDSAAAAYGQQYLGRAYLRLGDVAEAGRLLSQSLSMLSRMRGAGHNWTAQARVGVGMVYVRRQRYAEGERELQQALADQERTWGPTHRQLVEIYAALGELYSITSRDAEADSMYRRAIQVADASLVPSHRDRVAIRKAYAKHLRATKRNGLADSVERNMPFNPSRIPAFIVP